MRQRDDDWLVPVTIADAFLEGAWPEKSSDGELADRDEHFWFQQAQLLVEPVRAVGCARSGRRQVARVLFVPAWKAAHQGGDVGEAAKFSGVLESRAEHPPVELLAGATREGTPGFALRGTRRLADDEKAGAPYAGKGRVGLGDDPLVGADGASAACGLQRQELFLFQMTLARRGFGAAPGMRPRLVIGLPSISLMSAVKAMGGAELIDMPTP